MTYDYAGAWNNFTGHNAALYGASGDQRNADTGMQYWANNGMPKSKLILGIATYGRGWMLKSKTANQGVNATAVGPSKGLQYTTSEGDGAMAP